MSNAKAPKTEPKNAAIASDANAVQTPDFSKFVDESVGFAPYWSPKPGAWFYGALTALDARDPEFIRYECINLGPNPITCARGPADNAEPVQVAVGERFTISQYALLADLFNFYLECGADGFAVPFRCTSVEKIKGGQGTLWVYKVDMLPEVKKVLGEIRRKKSVKAISAGAQNGATAALPEA